MADPADSAAQSPAVDSADSFVEALVYITAHFGHARSAPALTAGLPVHKTGMTPKLFCTAAERAGFRARILKRAVDRIPSEVLPAVVILKNKKAMVLLEKQDKGMLRLFDPLTRQEKAVSVRSLKAESSGYAIYIKPEHAGDGSEESAALSRHWFWGIMLESRGLYGRVLVASVLINLFALTSPVYIMNFYNRVLPNDAVETGWVLSIGAASVFIFDFIIRTLRSYFVDLAGRRSDIVLSQRLYNQVLDMKIGQRTGSIGSFANTLREFDSLREFFNSATMTGLVDFPFSLLFVAAIWVIAGGQMAALLLALYLLVLVVGYFMQIPVRRKVHQAMKTAEQKHGLLVETISGLETIRGAGGEGALRAAYSHSAARSAESGQASRFYSGLSVNFSTLIQQVSVVFLVMLGMYLIKDKEMSVGALMACVLLSSRAIAPIGMVASLVNKYHHAKSAYRALDGVMRLPVERPPERKFLHRPELKGAFTFQGVEFSYPRTGRPVLEKVNLRIAPGDHVAIVGRIGSGKSSLIKLLVSFYEPTRGVILADETDMRQIDPADLRRNIAYMGQDSALLSGTVRENIVMGCPHATDQAVLKAAELAGVHDFIRRHPMGYDAPVGERGEGLSGGQRQSVALARALLMDVPVLIMDEPTNSMDAATEERVLKGLEEHAQNKTLVLVTHKPALLRLVNRIVVMENGAVILDGPRDQVLAALAAGQVAVPQS